jgi:diazepam-binding inhibitor (GABA receptor modulator, acyl-CoA-binding protein)
MDLQELFQQAVADSKNLPQKPSNDVMLKMYAFYKQATEGDINIEEPSNPFDFVAKAKYNAWEEVKGKSKEAAMQDYVDMVSSMK